MTNFSFKGSAYDKESVEEFVKKNVPICRLYLPDLYYLLNKIYAGTLSNRKTKLKIKTTKHVGSILKRSVNDFNAALVALVINLHYDRRISDITYIIGQSFSRDISTVLVKQVYMDVFQVLYYFIPQFERDMIFNHLGILFDYYYVIKN